MDDLINVYPGRDAALFVPGASDLRLTKKIGVGGTWLITHLLRQ